VPTRQSIIILGVDPGTLMTGYGVIQATERGARALEYDVIKNRSDRSMPLRLKAIYAALSEVIDRHHPDEFAIETAFYGKNAQSALKLGHARGVSILAAVSREIPTSEYSPRAIKKAVVGNGAASKEQVQAMVIALLRLKETPKLFDATDALAVALCHYQRSRHPVPGGGRRSTGRSESWKSFIESHPEKVRRAP
jgi:crossover junction endodeoxyribonuclease RuvC